MNNIAGCLTSRPETKHSAFLNISLFVEGGAGRWPGPGLPRAQKQSLLLDNYIFEHGTRVGACVILSPSTGYGNEKKLVDFQKEGKKRWGQHSMKVSKGLISIAALPSMDDTYSIQSQKPTRNVC